MNELSASKLYKGLFTWPAEAVLEAEKSYRKIWLEHIKDLELRWPEIDNDSDSEAKEENIRQLKALLKMVFDMDPVMKLNAFIETEVTMRVESSTEKGAEGGLQLEPFAAKGRYNSTHAQESTLRASAFYEMSNTKSMSLRDYVDQLGLEDDEMVKPEKFSEIKKLLGDEDE